MITINNQYIGNVRLLAVEDYAENEISIVFMEDAGLDEEDDYINIYKNEGVLSKIDFNFDSDCYFIGISQIEENQMMEISRIMKTLFLNNILEKPNKDIDSVIMNEYYNQEIVAYFEDDFKPNSDKILKAILKQCNIPKISQNELDEVGSYVEDVKAYNLGLKPEYEMYESN